MDPNNTYEVIFWDNLYKLRPWLSLHCVSFYKQRSLKIHMVMEY